MSQEKQRFFGLDFIRAFVALFVVLHHLNTLSPPAAWLRPFGSLGSLGVELLFVACGFFLGQTLLKMINENRFSTRKDLFGLFSKRWLRILPAYYFFLLVTAALFQPFFQLVLSHFEYFFFLQNFAWKMPSFYFQTWALAIIEFFYLLFSLSLFLCFKFSKRKLLSFVICLSLFAFIPLLLRATCLPLLGANDFESTIRRWVIYRLDGPVTGVIMALLMSEFPQAWNWLRAHSWISLPLFGGTVIYHLAGYPLLHTNHWLEVLFYPAVCTSFALTLPLLLTWRGGSSLFSAGISFLSKLSYSIYVCHMTAVVLVLSILRQTMHLDLKNWALVYPICFGFIILVAWFSYTFVEAPFLPAFRTRTKTVLTHVHGFFRRSLVQLAISLGLLTDKTPPPLREGQPSA